MPLSFFLLLGKKIAALLKHHFFLAFSHNNFLQNHELLWLYK